MSKKILYIVPHRFDRSPGQRFRCEQYIPYLKENGYTITYSNLLSEWDDKFFYTSGHYLAKLFILIKSIFIRCFDVIRALGYDYIFIYRESIMIGTNIFDRLFCSGKAKIIFDFDDSIWLNDTSEGNANLSWMKNPSKTNVSIKLADKIFAGNSYLANHAKQFNKNVIVIPTTIDMQYHIAKQEKETDGTIRIGWTGTQTTIKHFESIKPVLVSLKQKYGEKLKFILICDGEYYNKVLNLKNTVWNRHSEVSELAKIDIGIMPLPDDKWSRGKCGFKGLQYMSLGIPAVLSPVGVNKDIIRDGENGFLATSSHEWEAKLSRLIEDADLRVSLGEKGRATVESQFSVDAWKEKYIALFD